MVGRIAVSILLSSCLLLPGSLVAQTERGPRSEADSLRSELETLEQRVEALEAAKSAHEEATRAIIQQSIAASESRINNFVVFGGTFEQIAGWSKGFDGISERVMRLNTIEFDFEIQVGSTEPFDDQLAKRNFLAFMQAMQSQPAIEKQSNPRALARLLAHTFGYDESEVLATEDAAMQSQMVDTLGQFIVPGKGNGGGQPGLAAALDSMKVPPQEARQ